MSITNIAYGSIDALFPVAGQDNNSQGFRDNFSYIKAGLQIADANFTTLDQHTVKTDADNDLNSVRLYNATTNRLFPEVRIVGGDTSSDPGINVQTEGWEYHQYTIAANMWITFGGWPKDADDNGILGRVRLELVSDGTARTVDLALSPAGGTFMIDSTLSAASITTPAVLGQSVIVDVWSFDKGATVYVSKIGTFRAA